MSTFPNPNLLLSSSSSKFPFSCSLALFAGSMLNRVGTRLLHIPGKLMQIDSGPFGVVWGVDVHLNIFCRTGITWRNLQGRGWRRVAGKMKSLSCGQYGCWGVNADDRIFFRFGVSRRSPYG